jgi:hypothetical protein
MDKLRTPGTSEAETPDPLHRKPSSSPTSARWYLQDFHALKWIAIRREEKLQGNQDVIAGKTTPGIAISGDDMRPRKSYDEKVDFYLDELHLYMLKSKEVVIRKAYERCAFKTWKDVDRALANLSKADFDSRRDLDLKERLLIALRAIFHIFLPMDQKSTICGKFWGATHSAITVSLSCSVLKSRGACSISAAPYEHANVAKKNARVFEGDFEDGQYGIWRDPYTFFSFIIPRLTDTRR